MQKWEELKKQKHPYPQLRAAQLMKCPSGNLPRWVKCKAQIYQEAGKNNATRLLTLQSRKAMSVTVQGGRQVRQRRWAEGNCHLEQLKDYVLACVKERQRFKKPVGIKFVRRCSKKKLSEFESLGITVTIRGKPLKAARDQQITWRAHGTYVRKYVNKAALTKYVRTYVRTYVAARLIHISAKSASYDLRLQKIQQIHFYVRT